MIEMEYPEHEDFKDVVELLAAYRKLKTERDHLRSALEYYASGCEDDGVKARQTLRGQT